MNVLKGINDIKEFYDNYQRYYKETYGIIPTSKQLEVLESKDENIEITFERAEGCSTAAMIKAIEYAINNQKATVMFLVPSLIIGNIRMEQFRNMFEYSRLERHLLSTTRHPHVINLLNGSRILIVNSNTTESQRGACVDCLVVDGVRCFSRETLDTAICCTLHKKSRQVVLLDQVDLIGGQPINM